MAIEDWSISLVPEKEGNYYAKGNVNGYAYSVYVWTNLKNNEKNESKWINIRAHSIFINGVPGIKFLDSVWSPSFTTQNPVYGLEENKILSGRMYLWV